MPPHPTAQIAALGIEPTYSAREAAHLLRRSYSWLDQRLRQDQFIRPDGTTVQPFRTQGGYRRFTLAMRNFSRWMSPVGVRRLSWRSPGWCSGLVG